MRVKNREMNKNRFDGTWVQTKSDNMDAILKRMGYSWPVRKIAGAMGLHLIIDGSDRPGITTEFQTILKSTKMDLSFDHEVHDTGLTNSEKYTGGLSSLLSK